MWAKKVTAGQRNIIYSWIILFVSIALYQLNEFLAYLTVLPIVWLRDPKSEKNSWKKFKEKNPKVLRGANIVTLIFSAVVLVRVIYIFITNNNPTLESMPQIWSIAFIFSPLLILFLIHEYYLYKLYGEK